MNPALVEISARERFSALHQYAQESASTSLYLVAPAKQRRWPGSLRHYLDSFWRTIGWFVVSIGLRLALRQADAESAR